MIVKVERWEVNVDDNGDATVTNDDYDDEPVDDGLRDDYGDDNDESN